MKIFLSYGHDKNAELVEKIKQELERRHPDYDIWFDKNKIHAGDDWRRSIYDGLAKSNVVIACLSKHSVRVPGVCLDELRIAAGERTCDIASLLLESPTEVEPPLSISHIQYLDLSNWEQKKSEGEEVFQTWFNDNIAIIEEILANRKSFSGEIEELKKKLLPKNTTGTYIDRMQGLLRDGFVGREWIFNEIQEWLASDKKGKIFCITGEPGIGKSALVAQFATQNKIQVAGIHFCSAKSSLDNPRNVILSLAFQMGTRLPAYRRYLLNNEFDLSELSDDDLFVKLIGEASSFGIDGGQKPFILIVDALDEAEGELAEFIAKHRFELPSWLYLLVTSRPNEKHVKAHLASMNPRFMSAMAKENENDARLYIENWLGKSTLPDDKREALVKRILRHSGANFRYLVMLREMEREGVVSLEEIGTNNFPLPMGLSSLYQTFMDRVFASSDEFEVTGKPILGLLAVCGSRSLDLETFFEILKTKYQITESKAKVALNNLGSLIRRETGKKPGTGTVSLYHKSVADWLLSDENANYCLDIEETTIALIRHLWNKLLKSVGSEKREESFREKHASMLGQLLLDWIAPGNDLGPNRLNDFDETHLEELDVTEEDWCKVSEVISLYIDNYYEDPLNYQDVFAQWVLIRWFLTSYFYGETSYMALGAAQKLTDIFPPDIYPEIIDLAEELYKKAVKKYGPHSEERLHALEFLKLSLSDGTYYERQIGILDMVSDASEDIAKVYGEASVELAENYQWMAQALVFASIFDESLKEDVLELYKELNNIYKKIFKNWLNSLSGTEKKFIKKILQNPGSCKNLDLEQAEVLDEIREKEAENNSPSMTLAIGLINYAEQLIDFGAIGKAKEITHEAFSYLQLTSEPDDPMINKLRSQLYLMEGNYALAAKALQESVEFLKEIHGETSRYVAQEQSELAQLYVQIFDETNEKDYLCEAIKKYEEALTTFSTLHSDSRNTIVTRASLARLLSIAGDQESSLRQAESAFESCRRNRIAGESYIANCWDSIARAKNIIKPGSFDIALEMNRFLREEEAFWGAKVCNITSSLVRSYLFDPQKTNLLDICRRDLKLTSAISEDSLIQYIALGWEEYLHGDKDEAVKIFKKCLKLEKTGPDSEITEQKVVLRLCYSVVLCSIKDYKTAIKVFEEAEKIIAEYGEDPCGTEFLCVDLRHDALKSVIFAYESLGKKNKARKYVEEVAEIGKNSEALKYKKILAFV